MSSVSAVVRGVQLPRVSSVPESVFSHADDAVFLASGYGLKPDEWQRHVLDGWLGESASGLWASGRCGLAVPRQNGKNGAIEVRELFGMVALGEKFLHTAHEVKTARKAFKRLQWFFGERAGDPGAKFPELNALVKEVRNTNGQEAIVLKNGGSVEFIARSKGSGRGFTVDVLVLDEAQELTDEHMEALLPTVSASPSGNPQIIFTGTPPPPGSHANVFLRIRSEGIAGTGARLCWHEWSIAEPVSLEEIHDRALWAATNPALGGRLLDDVVEQELPPTLSLEGFMRERLGFWREQADGSTRLITADEWSDSAVDVVPDGVPSFGVAFSYDGLRMAVAGARKHDDGVFVELIGMFSGPVANGVSELAVWLAERTDKLAEIAISGAAGSLLVDALLELGVPKKQIHVFSAPDYFAACAGFDAGIRDKSITHSDVDGQAALADSVAVCDRKLRGNSGAWGWKATTPDGDETPIEAASVAARAAKTSKRTPGRKAKVMVMR